MNAITASSGTTSFNPTLGEIILDAFARVQIREASLTASHWFQARLSAGMLQSELSNIGMPLLFKIQELLVPLQPGRTSYPAPANIIAPLDAYIRTYQPGTGQSFTPVITGTAGSRTATVTQPLHGLGAGALAFFNTAIAASGQVVQGAYLISSYVDQNNYQIELAQPMDGTNSVALPVFTAVAGQSTVNINLANHNLAIGDSFYCNVPVTVGGLTLTGQLIVVGVTDQDNFSVGIGQGASTSGTATMNGGLAEVTTQAPGVDPIDFILYPLSRTDYVSQPDKGPNLSYRPTTFWFNRQINPTINFWNAPDNAGPYCFHLFAMIQQDDPEVAGGVGADVPFRWLATYAAGIAKNLARKFPPPPASGVSVSDLKTDYAELLDAALREDIERVPMMLAIGANSYYR